MTFNLKTLCYAFTLGMVLSVAAVPIAFGAGNTDERDLAISNPVSLKSLVNINDSVIRINDLFSNVDVKVANKVVAYAPDPGTRSIFDARWLMRVANAYKLDWRASSTYDQVTVVRASETLDQREIEAQLLSALIEKGADPDLHIKFANRSLEIHVAEGSRPIINVTDTAYDPTSMRFAANLSISSQVDAAQKQVRLAGKLVRMLDVPVPNKRLQAGDVIGKRDIEWLELPADRMQRNIIVDPSDLIGMVAKRGLKAKKPINSNEVHRQILVPKGSVVTMQLVINNMTLTAKGRALENGSDGDVIRISNAQTKSVVEATVTGAGAATVNVAQTLAMK